MQHDTSPAFAHSNELLLKKNRLKTRRVLGIQNERPFAGSVEGLGSGANECVL